MDINESSSKALKSLSLELGVPLELKSGDVFNSSGKKIQPSVVRKQSVDYTQQLLAKLVESTAVAAEPTQVNVQIPEPPKVSWKFNFIRNGDGTIESITAVPL